MKLKQGQIWKTETAFVRIVTLERLSVEYKSMKDLETMEGTHEKATKKAFCRLLKDATLVPAETLAERSQTQPK